MTFKQGQSGNPSGRPKGIVDKRTELRSLLESHAKNIIEKLVQLAKVGEPMALRLCVERLLPKIKPDEGIRFSLPEGGIDTGDNMLQITNDLTQAVALGQLTLNEAEKFTDFLKQQRHLIHMAENKIREEKWKKERDLIEDF